MSEKLKPGALCVWMLQSNRTNDVIAKIVKLVDYNAKYNGWRVCHTTKQGIGFSRLSPGFAKTYMLEPLSILEQLLYEVGDSYEPG